MRKILVLLLVVGLLVGTSVAILSLEETSGQEISYFEGEDIEETIGDPLPCGGGSSGGGGGAPG